MNERALGIDISGWQPGIDWKKVAGSGLALAFLYIKATEGIAYCSSEFEAQWQGCQGLARPPLRGAYHYWLAKLGGKEQAQWFLLHARKGELPPVLDVEDEQGLPENASQSALVAAASSLLDFVKAVQDAWSQPVMIYTGPWFWNRLANAAGRLAEQCELWGATYREGISAPDLPTGWKTWRIWQFTSRGKVPGIPGNVDMNYFNGSPDDLQAWAAGTQPPQVDLTLEQKVDILWKAYKG
jgi:lysozyme